MKEKKVEMTTISELERLRDILYGEQTRATDEKLSAINKHVTVLEGNLKGLEGGLKALEKNLKVLDGSLQALNEQINGGTIVETALVNV